MDELPPELLLLISENLDVESLLSLCLVQRRYSFICQEENGPLWNALLVRDFPGVIYQGKEDPTSKKNLYFKLRNVDYWMSLVISEEKNLDYAYLERANLQEANLLEANLQGANLEGANLQRANLLFANLQRANLLFANLQEANLQGENLEGSIDILTRECKSFLCSTET